MLCTSANSEFWRCYVSTLGAYFWSACNLVQFKKSDAFFLESSEILTCRSVRKVTMDNILFENGLQVFWAASRLSWAVSTQKQM